MIEPIMYVGIGFLVASLLVIGLIPLVHARAVRLTMKRLEALTPMSMAEIQAEKDQLRAEFAMSTRRLEMTVEQLKAKATSQLAEIGKKGEAVARLKLELDEKTQTMFALEARDKQMREEVHNAEKTLAARIAAHQEAERGLADTRAQIVDLTANLGDATLSADSQRVEVVALRAQVEVLNGRIEALETQAAMLNERLTVATAEIETKERQLTEERNRCDTLSSRIQERERQLVAQTTETEILERRVQELNARIDEQGRLLDEREYVFDQLRNETHVALQKEGAVRTEFAESESRRQAASDILHTEKTLLESQLRQAKEDRARLERDLERTRREDEIATATKLAENALMRERITDVAAEVARLTSLVEGPGNPIEAILAGEASRGAAAGNGASHGAAGNGENGKGSLADRIRALQIRAGRAAPPSGA